jgi:polyferredoxin
MTLHSFRRCVQIFSLFLFHAAVGPLAWLQARSLCLPVLSCHACALSWTACPIGVLLHFSGWHIFPFVALGFLLAFGALVGRLLCGWVCPFGTLQALLYRIPSPKIKLPAWTSYIKYVILILTVFLFPFIWGELTAASFCRICPAAFIQVVVPTWIQNGFTWAGWLSGIRVLFFVLVVVLAILSSRSFCKVFCPIGALLAPLNYLSFWKVKSPDAQCVACKRCDRLCSTDVQPSLRILEGIDPNRHPDCIVCHECQHPTCPVSDEKMARKAEATQAKN